MIVQKNCGGGKKKKVYNIIQNAEQMEVNATMTPEQIEEDCNTQQCPIDCKGEFVDLKSVLKNVVVVLN